MNITVTKVLAALVTLGGVAGYFLGSVNSVQALQMIFAGLAVFGIRQAITAQVTGGHSIW